MASKFTDAHHRFSDVAAESGGWLPPLRGFEDMPLVPLDEAVKPLIPHVPEIQHMVYIVRRNNKEPKDCLTMEESASIMLYSLEWPPPKRSFYYILNSMLRSPNRQEQLPPWLSYLRLFMTGLSKLRSIPAQHVFRGVKADLRSQYAKGSTCVWWGFSSCTLSASTLENEQFLGKNGPRTLFSITCDSGKSIINHSCFVGEEEVLLLPGREFKVVGCLDMGNQLHMIQLKEIQPPFPHIATITLPSRPVISKHSLKDEPHRKTPPNDWASKSPTPKPVTPITLTYSFKGLGDGDMQRVMHQALVEKRCTSLNLSFNKITIEGAIIIGEAIRNNKTLTELNLGGNPIGDKGAQSIADTMRTNTTLNTLNLWGNQIGDQGVQSIVDALQRNTTLTTLNLSSNQIGEKGAQCIADALKTNRTLTTLNLSFNQIGEKRVQSIADALQRNTTLTTLYLYGNQIGEKGVQSIADALRTNTTLTTLDLGDNQIGEKGAQSIADALRTNTTLTTLNLWNNQIGEKGAQSIADALRTNTTLTTLDLGGNQIGEKSSECIKKLVQRNANKAKSQ